MRQSLHFSGDEFASSVRGAGLPEWRLWQRERWAQWLLPSGEGRQQFKYPTGGSTFTYECTGEHCCVSASRFDADADADSAYHPNAILIFIWCGSGSRFLFLADADPDLDPTFRHPYADPDRKKCTNRLIFHTLWLFICKLMRIRFQILILIFIWCLSGSGFLFLWGCGSRLPKWSGYGSTTLPVRLLLSPSSWNSCVDPDWADDADPDPVFQC